MEQIQPKDMEFNQINELYDECINYLQTINNLDPPNENVKKSIDAKTSDLDEDYEDPGYETIQPKQSIELKVINTDNGIYDELYKPEKLISFENITTIPNHVKSTKQNEEKAKNNILKLPDIDFKVENELIKESTTSLPLETKSERLRRLSEQLPKIIITKSNSTIEVNNRENIKLGGKFQTPKEKKKRVFT